MSKGKNRQIKPKSRAMHQWPQLMTAIKHRIISPSKIFVSGLISGLILIGGLVVYWPRISVEHSAMFDSRSPFQSTFRVKNDGFFICYTVRPSVHFKKLEFEGMIVRDGDMYNFNENITRLCPNDSHDISLQNTFKLPTNFVNYAEIYIDLSYKPTWPIWIPFNFHDSYRYKIERTVNGDYFWRRLFTDK